MNSDQRWNFYELGWYHQTVALALLDWAGYWSGPNMIETITDDMLREQTRQAVYMIITDPTFVIKEVKNLVISDEAIVAATEVDEAMIKSAVVTVMASKIRWVTNIWPTT